MRRLATPTSLVLALVAAAVPATAGGQSLPDPVLRGGEVRLSGGGSFLSWRERFGVEGEREPLAIDLTRESAAELVPGLANLQTALQGLLGGGLPLRLGASTALVSHNEVRVPLSLDVGVLDRVTLGVTVPLVKTTVEADLLLATDPDADLGLNPAVASPTAVSAFVETLDARAAEADALAGQLCGAQPGSAECSAATALAADLLAAHPLMVQAYRSSGLFPAAGTPAGNALVAWFAAVDATLTDLGLGGLGGAPPLAAAVLDREGFQSLLADPAGPIAASPLASYGSLWGIGDVEARVAARLLGGERTDTAGVPTFAWSLAAVGTVRLPTGTRDSVGVFLDRGRGDGQMDVEGTAHLGLATRRFALRAQATYTLQQSAEIETRLAPYGMVISGRGDAANVDWDPGDVVRLDVEPAFRIAPALSLSASYRYLRQGQDSYTRNAPLPGAPDDGSPLPSGVYTVDASVLDVGTEVELHEVGGALTYRSVGLPETERGGFEAFARVRKALSGSGGRVPAGLRAEFGLSFVRRLWGGG